MASRPPSPSQLRGEVQHSSSLLPYNTSPYTMQEHPLPSQDSVTQTMGRSHNSLDIVLAAEAIYLKGTGPDVEPATLHGNLVLNLVEATPFKEITMHFRAKSRLPNMQNDSSTVLGGSYQTNVLFTHDWSFLEGCRRHTPTLKAGRHVFPFQLQLHGNLPSSLSLHGGVAGVNYKLRATAVRPVFATNLHATAAVRVIRSLAPEALEYQQTLEVENTWPEKIMYSLMVPHKAWAAGDTVTTLIKFSPLVKGVRIMTVTSTVRELTKTYTKTGASHDDMRTIATAKHEIRDGRAVTLQATDSRMSGSSGRWTTPPWSTPNTPSPSTSDDLGTPSLDGLSSLDPFSIGAQQILSGVPIMGTPQLENAVHASSSTSVEPESAPSTDEAMGLGEEEVVTTLPLTLPVSATPSHTLEPVTVSYRIRWSILISNPDGHTSELRCSLPLHVLDHALIDEARAATAATRRLLFGLQDTQSNSLEMELPSYPAHVLDRIANAYIPATDRMSNPWPFIEPHSSETLSRSPDAPGSPLVHFTPHDTPPITPGDTSHNGVALDWVNSELHRLGRAWQRPVHNTTPPDSTQTSRHPSRSSSRAASPERSGNGRAERHAHSHHSIFSLKPFTKVASSLHHKDGHAHGVHRLHLNDGAHASSSARPSPTQETAGMSFPREDGAELLNRAFNEVPDYDVASRGFLGGGVTPLSSTRGLPSYEEAERSQSESDLAARFAAARTRTLTGNRLHGDLDNVPTSR